MRRGQREVAHRWVAVALVLSLQSEFALSVTTNTTFTVSVAVPATCVISATALSFLAYTGVVDVATSSISMTCSNTTHYNVGLSAGLASGATVSTRRMSSGANLLSYSLYSDASRTLNWGQTVSTDTVTGTGNGTAQVLTVYGRVPAGQFVSPGNYNDTVIATVTY